MQSPSDYGPAFYFNFDAPNPALRDAFRDIRVLTALSHTMNREEEKSQFCFNLIPSIEILVEEEESTIRLH